MDNKHRRFTSVKSCDEGKRAGEDGEGENKDTDDGGTGGRGSCTTFLTRHCPRFSGKREKTANAGCSAPVCLLATVMKVARR